MVHFVDSGADEDELAPVTPLFGGRATAPRTGAPVRTGFPPRTGTAEGRPRAGSDEPRLRRSASRARPTPFGVAGDDAPGLDSPGDDGSTSSPRDVAAAAEKTLVRKLAARSLSVSEARDVLRTQGLGSDDAETLIAAFIDRGYLDDDALAEQLVHAGVDRKGQGRRAIAMTLSQRGVPRDIGDRAVAALPDDDAERALDFARSKARSLARLDGQTALRRLCGQLARRGYGGSVATEAARTALREAGGSL